MLCQKYDAEEVAYPNKYSHFDALVNKVQFGYLIVYMVRNACCGKSRVDIIVFEARFCILDLASSQPSPLLWSTAGPPPPLQLAP